MKTSRTKAAAERVPRRWRTPPPLTRGSESLEGMEILREVGGEVGVLLWQAYRNVMFWSMSDAADRGQLFSADAGTRRRQEVADARVPERLSGALESVAVMLESPEGASGDAVAEACTAIGQWAEDEGYMNTALAYTQAAAVASPGRARLALAVGQLARRRAELARAETWFRHTIMIGRQTGDWESYSRAYIALGNMLVRRGNFPGAHRMHIKALRAARRKGMPEIQGMALHDLFTIAIETGRHEQAEEYARQAFRAYGPIHDSIPALAHDVAYYWMERGHFARSLDVFQALESHLSLPSARLILLASTARAAAGTGNRDVFRKAWTQVTRLSRDAEAQGVAPGCMLELALGAASLGEWDRAEQAADESYEGAVRQGQGKVRFRAEALLESIRNDRVAAGNLAAARSSSPKVDALASDFVRSLRGPLVEV
ncbi:tetratricopeptide repeat protein [Longimicrobium terrae]|uniref:Tetratricopeptide (TPR) repeat protein n=1 Tax=Longimicrobium terrae TaxID=1639882 RepID=A0A841H1V4_9BACT|nr:tetratricopeptide repeat protein [Longimicrobium terrae]MBB4637664.1 tetratricopeptide (TPR) repeat protein [Longimicrobium terrae]MBB6072061.1 tetratricopeptide (TPR) repeat protein [Longimicrobium terrae]NNC29855.1 tetratricopeptide repeat protein [Longimicrobium terrae]